MTKKIKDQVSTFTPEKRLEWEQDRSNSAILYYIAILMGEFALMNMAKNPLTVRHKKLVANRRRRKFMEYIEEVKNSSKKIDMEEDYQREDGLLLDKVGAMASVCYMMAQLPTEQCFSFVDKAEVFMKDGINEYLQEKIDSGEYNLTIWTMNDGETYKFVHNMADITNMLSEFYKEKGVFAPVNDFMMYCRVKKAFISTL